MKKKGFTLVELLAVIVILAVIALIAVPVVLNMIEKARIGSAEDSVYSYVKGIEDSIVTGYLSGTDYTAGDYNVGDIKVNVKGTTPTNGSYKLDSKNEVISGKFCINGYSIDYDGKHAIYNKDENYCNGIAKAKVCKRATILHTEICNESDFYDDSCEGDGYEPGDIITYGNLGTKGALESGDAFDCDVNGDGTYDSETERFYYVTDLDANTVAFIYYNNTTNGTPDNMSNHAYNTNSSVGDSTPYLGPQTLMSQLPTTTQWSNINLKNSKRNIIDENGNVKVSNYSYDGYAARLLTFQEVTSACYDGTNVVNSKGALSVKCKYLMENTKYSNKALGSYGTWLETPTSDMSYRTWYVYSGGRGIDATYAISANGYAVRPVIEVPKIDIDY